MEEKEIHDELATIRGLMERSSKFISLSGLSGILAGVYALVGAGVAYKLVGDASTNSYFFLNGIRTQLPITTTTPSFNRYIISYPGLGVKLLAIGVLVLFLSLVTGVILSIKKAKQKEQAIWGKTSRTLLFNMAIPLIAGGVLVFIILYEEHNSIMAHYSGLIVPIMLIFYGLSLVSASNFTFTMVKYLGLCEILLGLIAACLPGYGLLFWALGFGVLHIIYGGMMYLKYDR